MDNSFLKIKRISIENIKNVCNGVIDLTDGENYLNVLGIYGQNGSGKTALIDSLSIIKSLILGDKLNDGLVDLLSENKISKLDIQIAFEQLGEVNYIVKMVNKNDKVKILSENLFLKKSKKYQRNNLIFSYESEDDTINVDFYGGKNREYNQNEKVEILTAHALSVENSTSLLFSERMINFIKDEKNQKIMNSNLSKTVSTLYSDFARNVFIYSNRLSGMIYAEIFFPMSFQVDNVSGLVPIPMDASKDIPEDLFNTAEMIFEQINRVLPKLIPGLTVRLRVEDKSKNLEGEMEYKVSIDSIRNNQSIHFRKESDGIKKIVSILSTLINVYNSSSVIAVVDELDAGIFEFLLGEIIEVLSDDAKGQLIFTSHNLRALEVLPHKKIIFTTTNPENRYIRIPNVKRTNNLRDMYIRAIQLGGMEEELYLETDAYEMKRSFRKAVTNLRK